MQKLFSREAKPASNHPLALFYYCDTAVTHQMDSLNSLMRTTPDNLGRRSRLITELKESQHNMITVLQHITSQLIPAGERESLDFRAKYSDEVQMDQINGPIWFGAECLTAGSHIANHEEESTHLRPDAIKLCNSIKRVRDSLKKECFSSQPHYSPKLLQNLKSFDTNWAQFEYSYVSLMTTVKSKTQLYQLQDVAVLFSEAAHRALKKGYLTLESIEMFDPSVMFAIPRLAIVCGLSVYPDGPINPDNSAENIPRCFRAYRKILLRIRELMGHLSEKDLTTLERALCSAQGLGSLKNTKTVTSVTSDSSVSSNSSSSSERIVSKTSCKDRQQVCTKSAMPVGSANCHAVPEASWFNTLSQQRRTGRGKPTLKRQLSDSALLSNTRVSLSPAPAASSAPASPSPQPKPATGPAGFSSVNDLLHRLFVVISGIADKLQSNYAEDMRAIMKMVFELVLSEPNSQDDDDDETCCDSQSACSSAMDQELDLSLSDLTNSHITRSRKNSANGRSCSVCQRSFSVTLRRHHCKFCGKLVCRHCSPHSLPKSHKFLRSCNSCFLHELSRVTQSVSSTSPFSAVAFS